MVKRDELLRQAKEARALAAKAQRLAIGWGNTNPDDISRLMSYAEELDEKARTLEVQALKGNLFLPPVGPVVTYSQKQAQQQSETVPFSHRAPKEQGDSADSVGPAGDES